MRRGIHPRPLEAPSLVPKGLALLVQFEHIPAKRIEESQLHRLLHPADSLLEVAALSMGGGKNGWVERPFLIRQFARLHRKPERPLPITHAPLGTRRQEPAARGAGARIFRLEPEEFRQSPPG